MLRLVSVLLLVLAASAAADPVTIWPLPVFPPDLPVACFPSPRLNWLGDFQNNLTRSRSAPVDLVFDGDCATLFLQRSAKVWAERFAPRNAFDFAQVWDGIQNILWRVDNGELEGLHPKLIVLMISSHDNQSYSASDIDAGITALVAAYREHSPASHILLLGTLPAGASPNDPARAKVTEINRAIAKLDDGKNITFLDIGARFLQPDGTLPEEMTANDDSGLTEKAYTLWADAIQPVVDQYCPQSSVTAPTAFQGPLPLPQPVPVTYPLPAKPEGIPATTFPLPVADWYDRFQGNLDKLKDGPYDLVFDGDSITDNWQGPGAEVWKERYGSLKAIDIAIGGDQVQHLLWRVAHGDLAGQNPKLIVLTIGTNNGGQEPKAIANGIRLLLNEYETRCPRAHILLEGVFPRDHEANTGTRNWVKAINAILSTYVSDPRVTYMDFGDKFLEPDGTLSADIMPDFLHPSAKGYVIWADAIQPVIDRYVPKPAAP
jgi:lysophospholipase L1-like esterase